MAFVSLCVSAGVQAGCAGGHGSGESSSPFSARDLDLAQYQGSTVSRRFRAKQVLVVPRRVGPFELAGFYDLVVTGAKLDVFLEHAAAPGAPGPDVFGVPVRPGLQVASGSIFELEWAASRSGRQTVRFTAARARMDFRSGDVTLQHFRMTHVATGRVVESSEAVLRRGTDLTISGEFVMRDGASERHGRGLRMSLEGS